MAPDDADAEAVDVPDEVADRHSESAKLIEGVFDHLGKSVRDECPIDKDDDL
jgi:hypothetical protein